MQTDMKAVTTTDIWAAESVSAKDLHTDLLHWKAIKRTGFHI